MLLLSSARFALQEGVITYALWDFVERGCIKMAESEVARLMRAIEQECAAMKRGMEGYATVSSHETITHKYNVLAITQEQLETLVGKQTAMSMVFETYARVME